MDTILLTLAALTLLILGVICPILLAIWLLRTMARHPKGSWAQLAARFPARETPVGDFRHGRTVEVGRVRHQRCVTLGATPEGLYLRDDFPGLGKLFVPLLIPWSACRAAAPTRLQGRAAVLVTIGEPSVGTITLLQADNLFVRDARRQLHAEPTARAVAPAPGR